MVDKKNNVNPKRKRGRPVESDARRNSITFRGGERDKYMLERIAEATGDNYSDIIRIALHGYYIHLREEGKISGKYGGK